MNGLDFKKLEEVNPVKNAFPLFNPSTTAGKESEVVTVSGLVTNFLGVGVSLLVAVMFVWMIWGAYDYLFSNGNKEAVKRGQSRITWALIGFVITIASYIISGVVLELARYQK